jgi:spoIIIJ-associated protein
MDKKIQKIIHATAQEMLDNLELEATLKIEEQEEEIKVEIEPKNQEPAFLIGYHGETLNSFQHLLKMIVFKKTDQWPSLVVETAGYREKRKETLESMAHSAAEQTRLSGRPVTLPPLSSFERRIIHLVLKDEPEIFSESEGEGRDRKVVVKPKSEAQA